MEKEWGGTKSNFPVAQCDVSTVSDDLGCHVIYCHVYQDILEHFMLLSADKLYGDADFFFWQDLALPHTAKTTSNYFTDLEVTVLSMMLHDELNIFNFWALGRR